MTILGILRSKTANRCGSESALSRGVPFSWSCLSLLTDLRSRSCQEPPLLDAARPSRLTTSQPPDTLASCRETETLHAGSPLLVGKRCALATGQILVWTSRVRMPAMLSASPTIYQSLSPCSKLSSKSPRSGVTPSRPHFATPDSSSFTSPKCQQPEPDPEP